MATRRGFLRSLLAAPFVAPAASSLATEGIGATPDAAPDDSHTYPRFVHGKDGKLHLFYADEDGVLMHRQMSEDLVWDEPAPIGGAD